MKVDLIVGWQAGALQETRLVNIEFNNIKDENQYYHYQLPNVKTNIHHEFD